jgi:hypothetical protein
MHGLVLRGTLAAVLLTFALAAAAPLAASTPGNAYTVTPLVSDVPGAAPNPDPHLVNGWGLARSQTSPWWVADNRTNRSSLYTGAGTVLALAPTVEAGRRASCSQGSPVTSSSAPRQALRPWHRRPSSS